MESEKPEHPFWRQGDIFFVKLGDEASVAEATPVKSGIIARGEQTGHSHRLATSSLAAGAALYVLARSLYLRAPEAGATIVHDEHKPISLPAGAYEVVRQREFDGLGWREVRD